MKRSTTYLANREAIEVAMLGTQLLGVRVATLTLMLPLLVLIYVVAAADGLTQRAIRRASAGRESASLYHRAKHLQVVVAGTATLALLVWPAPVDWLRVGLPLAAVARRSRPAAVGVLQEASLMESLLGAGAVSPTGRVGVRLRGSKTHAASRPAPRTGAHHRACTQAMRE